MYVGHIHTHIGNMIMHLLAMQSMHLKMEYRDIFCVVCMCISTLSFVALEKGMCHLLWWRVCECKDSAKFLETQDCVYLSGTLCIYSYQKAAVYIKLSVWVHKQLAWLPWWKLQEASVMRCASKILNRLCKHCGHHFLITKRCWTILVGERCRGALLVVPHNAL